MIRTWYIPSWTGDFRLDGKEENTSLLTVTDPTEEEWARLKAFLVTARSKNWIDGAEGVVRRGTTELLVGASTHAAGCVLASELAPRRGVLTAVASEGGQITGIVDGTRLPDPESTPSSKSSEPEIDERATRLAIEGITPAILTQIRDGEHDDYIGAFLRAEKAGKNRKSVLGRVEKRMKVLGLELPVPVEPSAVKGESAVTVRRPTLCCPTPIDGAEIRASQVLEAFCSPVQWAHWMEHGWIVAYGKYTGHAYRICHRHTPLAKKQGKITMDLDDQAIVHCYDWSVPPPEEVLAIKLILEHREDWLRNSSTLWDSHWARNVFHNPLGHEVLDGTKDAAIVAGVGGGLMGHFFGKLLGGG